MNIALNKPVSVSTSHANYKKENLTDGNTATQWLAAIGGLADGTWCVVDLQLTYKLISVELTAAYGCSSFDVEVSTDGINYKKVLINQTKVLHTTQSYDVGENVVCRYLKINNIKTSYANVNQGLAELKAYGEIHQSKNLIKSLNQIHTLFEDRLTYLNLQEPLTQDDYEKWGMDSLYGYENAIDKVAYEMNEMGELGNGRLVRRVVNRDEFRINRLEVR